MENEEKTNQETEFKAMPPNPGPDPIATVDLLLRTLEQTTAMLRASQRCEFALFRLLPHLNRVESFGVEFAPELGEAIENARKAVAASLGGGDE